MKEPKISMQTVQTARVLMRAAGQGLDDLIPALRDAASLERLSAKLKRLGEEVCNGVIDPKSDWRNPVTKWDEADEERNSAAQVSAMTKARAIVEPYGVTLRRQGDPRGVSFYIVAPDDREHGV